MGNTNYRNKNKDEENFLVEKSTPLLKRTKKFHSYDFIKESLRCPHNYELVYTCPSCMDKTY